MRNTIHYSVAALMLAATYAHAVDTSNDQIVHLTAALPNVAPSEIARLVEEGELLHHFKDHTELHYAPPAVTEALEALVATGFQSTIGVEGVFYYPRNRNPSFFGGTRAPQRLALYNVLRSVSSMQGIEYYSASRQIWRTFFHESYAIASPESTDPLPDPLVTDIPSEAHLYIFQRDSSFGSNRYSATYRYTDESTLLTISNLTTMSYFIFPLVQPEGMQIIISLMPFKEGLIYYGFCAVEVANLFGFEERVYNSFTNRVRALYRWFASQLDALTT